MKILSVSCFVAYWQRYPANVLDLTEGLTIGGGEEAFMRTAVGLRKLGHEVTAYHYGQSGVWNGVEFRGPECPIYPEILGNKWDAVIAWSGIWPLEYAPKGATRLMAQQLNDCYIMGDWSRVDCVVSPSRDHASQLPKWGWQGPRAVVHNGVVPEVYVDAPAWEARPFNVGYWSSPDRGLIHLLRAWPLIREREPRAKLHVYYEIKRYLANATWMPHAPGWNARALQAAVLEAELDPSIVFHGATPRLTLAKQQKLTRVQCYPYDVFAYCEGFGTSVAQGLAAGCKVLTTPRDAFPSLYGGAAPEGCGAPLFPKIESFDYFERTPLDSDFVEHIAEKTVAALRETPTWDDARLASTPRSEAINRFDWANAAKQMEAACERKGWF